MAPHRRWVGAALRLHDVALAAGVASAVRERYGEEMRATFADQCEAAARRGRLAVVLSLLHELFDLGRLAAARAGHALTAARHEKRKPMTLLQDIRYASRLLLRQRGFAAVAVITLALGIGITTAVFTVVNGVLLRPLPFASPDRLVLLLYGSGDGMSPWLSPLNFQDYVAQSGVVAQAAAMTPTTANLTGGGDPERVAGSRVSTGFFDVLGVRLALGRGFAAGDTDTIVLSDRLWRRRFGARPDAVSSTMTLDGNVYTIVGVAPPEVRLPAAAEFWRPLVFAPRDVAPQARGALWVQAVARLRPGVTTDSAAAALSGVAHRFATAYPDTERNSTAGVIPLHERIVRTIRSSLLLLLGAVALVLVIACANVAGLLMARATDRRREIAVRSALGAGRARIVRQFLVESAVLGLAGAAAGVPLAYALVRFALRQAAATLPRASDVRIDTTVLGFTVLIGFATSVAFGLAPAVLASRRRLSGDASRGVVGASRRRARKVLVVAEIALAGVLLAASGLLLRSYQNVQAVDPGFDASRTTTFSLSLPDSTYGDAGQAAGFTSRLLDRVRALPGVESAAVAMRIPFSDDLSMYTAFRVPGVTQPGGAAAPNAALRIVSAGYFETVKLPIRRGRGFDAGDTATSPEVVVINERMAERYFGGIDPLGRQFTVSLSLSRGARNGPKTVIGIAGNVKSDALDAESAPEIYLPYTQEPVSGYSVLVRTAAEGTPIAAALRREVGAIDPTLPLAGLRPFAELVDASVASRRFAMLLVTVFAVLAAALAAIGVYGVIAYLVAQRTAEIGVRVAMGATPNDIAGLFGREALVLSAIGILIGLAGAVVAGRLLSASLFNVTPSDPLTLAIVTLVLGAAAFLATAIPIRRAVRVDPTTALRLGS
jgi:putative ABC transport system permease protein